MIRKVIGPMCAGKSLALIKTYLSDEGSKVCIKPAKFDRDGCSIKSRAINVELPCILVGSGIGHSFGGVDSLYVDEAMGMTLPELAYLSRMAKNVYFYGLDYMADGSVTSLGEFETDETVTLTADCTCGGVATRSKHISGDAVHGVYEAVCLGCFE